MVSINPILVELMHLFWGKITTVSIDGNRCVSVSVPFDHKRGHIVNV